MTSVAELATITVADIESMPITAFYWHDDLNSYVIERGDILQFFNPYAP